MDLSPLRLASVPSPPARRAHALFNVCLVFIRCLFRIARLTVKHVMCVPPLPPPIKTNTARPSRPSYENIPDGPATATARPTSMEPGGPLYDNSFASTTGDPLYDNIDSARNSVASTTNVDAVAGTDTKSSAPSTKNDGDSDSYGTDASSDFYAEIEDDAQAFDGADSADGGVDLSGAEDTNGAAGSGSNEGDRKPSGLVKTQTSFRACELNVSNDELLDIMNSVKSGEMTIDAAVKIAVRGKRPSW